MDTLKKKSEKKKIIHFSFVSILSLVPFWWKRLFRSTYLSEAETPGKRVTSPQNSATQGEYKIFVRYFNFKHACVMFASSVSPAFVGRLFRIVDGHITCTDVQDVMLAFTHGTSV